MSTYDDWKSSGEPGFEPWEEPKPCACDRPCDCAGPRKEKREELPFCEACREPDGAHAPDCPLLKRDVAF